MSNASPKIGMPAANANDRDAMLNAIGTRWSKFSKIGLSALKSNDELVSQIVAKYGLNRIMAQGDVEVLMGTRQLAP
jgi:hypothetical protein